MIIMAVELSARILWLGKLRNRVLSLLFASNRSCLFSVYNTTSRYMYTYIHTYVLCTYKQYPLWPISFSYFSCECDSWRSWYVTSPLLVFFRARAWQEQTSKKYTPQIVCACAWNSKLWIPIIMLVFLVLLLLLMMMIVDPFIHTFTLNVIIIPSFPSDDEKTVCSLLTCYLYMIFCCYCCYCCYCSVLSFILLLSSGSAWIATNGHHRHRVTALILHIGRCWWSLFVTSISFYFLFWRSWLIFGVW